MLKKLLKFYKKNTLILFLILLICVTIFLYKTVKEGFTDDTAYDIVIVAGQSNAQGNGLDYFTPHYQGMSKTQIDEPLYNDPYFQNDKSNNNPASPSDNIRNRIKMLKSNNTIVTAEDPLDHFSQTAIKTRQNPHGFGIPFARQYVKEKDKSVLLVGCAMGSTAFGYYGPANGGSDDPSHQFGWSEANDWPSSVTGTCNGTNCSLFRMSKARIDAAKAQAPNSRVVAILWHQGENDADHNPSSYYASGVSRMLKDLRSYAIQQFPNSPSNFPILVGGLCTYYSDYSDKMNPILRSMENSSDNIRFVPSDNSLGSSVSKFNHNLRPNGRSDFGGRVHFSRMAQIEFGYRYFYVFNNKSINFN